MTPLWWTKAALADLESILEFTSERSPGGAATIAARVRETVNGIATFPRGSRRDPETGVYEAVVRGLSLLVVYEIVDAASGLQVDIIAVFHTARDPATKPGRRA